MNRNDTIRREVLLQLYAVHPLALTPNAIAREALKQGLRYAVNEVHSACEFLAGEKLVETAQDPSISETSYKITSAGIRHYETKIAP